MKNVRFLIVILLILGLLTGCAGKAAEMENGAYDKSESPMDAPTDLVSPGASSTGAATPEYQKKIRNLELQAETEDMDTLLGNIEARTIELGGYVEQKEVYRGSAYADRVYRHGTLTLRVPAEKADQLVQNVGEISNITNMMEDVDDVTLQYVATESRITALTTEETRLLELLAKAENMEDLLMIEARLTEVRAELEEYTSQLRIYDNLVNYATIRLNIQEVREYTPVEEETFWQRIGSGFSESLENLGEGILNFIVFFISAIPYLVLIGAILTVFLLAFKAARKRRQQKRAANSQE